MHTGLLRPGTKINTLLQECKSITRRIKSQQEPKSWHGKCGEFFPPKVVADQLLHLYITKFEPFYRIIHIPSIKAEYESHWQNPSMTDTFQILKIQLCLALGCYLYDDEFSLRKYVARWIHESKMAMVILGKPPSGILGMQLLCLLHIARRHYKGKEGAPAWISGGTLYQAALYMGLHLDPSALPTLSTFETEMRRRLWATTLELQLDSSLDTGTSPLTSFDGHDCQPPSNINDDQLDPEAHIEPIVSSDGAFTDVSLQLLYHQSFNLRLKILKILNNTRYHAPYEEIIQLTSELNDASQTLRSRLNSYGSSISDFQRRWVEILLRRYFTLLHVPYMQLAMKNPLYYFSRKVCVDNAIQLCYEFTPSINSEKTLEALRAAANIDSPCDEIPRLSYCTASHARVYPLACINIISAELSMLLAENPQVSRKMAKSQEYLGLSGNLQVVQLHALLRGALRNGKCRLKAAQPDVKLYVHMAALLAEIEATLNKSVPELLMNERAAEALIDAKMTLQPYLENDETCSGTHMNLSETLYEPHVTNNDSSFWLDQIQGINWEDFNPSSGHSL
jgi:hypothetical protein